MSTGVIYKITNQFNGYCYIGSTIHERARLARHMRHLKKGKHINKAMQQDYNEFGQFFTTEVIRRDIPEDELHQCEMVEILNAQYESEDRVYNKSRVPRISGKARKLLAARNMDRLLLLNGRFNAT